MDKKLSGKFHEEIWRRFGFMTDQMQRIFIKLSHKFWNEDRPLKKGERIDKYFDFAGKRWKIWKRRVNWGKSQNNDCIPIDRIIY